MRHTKVAMAGALAAAVMLAGTINVLAKQPPHRGHPAADFALLNEPGGDTSVQCGARGIFTLYVTMTNRADLGGADGKVRVLYRDGDFVDYWIPVSSTLQITLAGGGSPAVDDIIVVRGDGPGGAVLVGQISLFTDKGRPSPFLPEQGDDNKVDDFCTTSP